MRKFTNPLDGVRIAAPCRADWEKMVGDERMRYCGQCSLHVYNLSGMTRQEAEALVTNAEGGLCVRFYRRADGTILTRNCPVGLRALKARATRVAGAALSAVLGLLAGVGFDLGFSRATAPHVMGDVVSPVTENQNTVGSETVPDEQFRPTMGVANVRPVVGKMMLSDYTLAHKARTREAKRRADGR